MMESCHSDMICHYDKQLPELMDEPGFYEYALEVYNYLELMKPGTILNLQTDQNKLPWLLVVTGAFLNASDHWMDFELNDDYTRLRRKLLPDHFRKAMRNAHTG